MKKATIDFWVGFFVLIGICAIVFLALRVANQASMNNNPTYTVTAFFTNIGGLKVRSPVKSAGVAVGRVTSIQLDASTYRAKVELAIDQRYRFSSDSSAAILTSGLLGEQYISLETGAEEDNLKEGSEITLTSSALVIENLVGKLIMSQSGEEK